MCGFTGFYAFNEIGRLFGINLAKSNDALAHRGPDDAYLFLDHKVGLGHRRLAIIDKSSAARQPMTDVSGRYTLAYNGEIYNFKALRKQLEAKGITFRSNSDTEVLLYSLITFGEKCLPMLNGCFAFAFYDRQTHSFLLARDRYGIKPLYYYYDEDKCLFASELSALLAFNIEKAINYEALFRYFELNYIPAGDTIFKHTFKLLPGHWLKIQGRETELAAYDALPESTFRQMPTYQEAGKRFMALLEDAVCDRLVSDVPLGAFLSGGIDSSTVVALAARHLKKLNTFSVGYRDEPFFDETKYACEVAQKYNTEHSVFSLSNDELFAHIDQILHHFSEPFADASAIPTYILSQKTREKITVSLSGDGGDELLAGYQKHSGEWRARHKGWKEKAVHAAMPLLKKLPKNRNAFLSNKVRQLHRFAQIMALPPKMRYWHLCRWNDEKSIKKILSDNVIQKINFEYLEKEKNKLLKDILGNDFNEVLKTDFRLLLPNDMLHKVDTMSMAHGLEVRTPFLDHRLVNYTFQLTSDYKITGGFKKKILQDFARPLLPESLYRRSKKGFDVPLTKAYRTTLRSWINDELLAEDFVAAQGIFRPEEIKKLKTLIFNSDNFDQNQVWGILCFQQWWKNHFN